MRRTCALALVSVAALMLAACGPGRRSLPSSIAGVSGPGGTSSPTGAKATKPTSAGAPSAASPRASSIPPPDVTRTVVGTLHPLPTGTFSPSLTDVAFSSAATGAAVGYRCTGAPERCTGVVITTSDGGRRWTQAVAVPEALTNVRFLSGGFGWAWGPAGLYATVGGGRAWHALTVPSVAGFRGEPLMFASFANSTEGWAALGGVNCATQGCPITIFQTTDGGAQWTPVADNLSLGPTPSGLPKPSLGWLNFEDGGYLGAGKGWLVTDTPIGAVWTTTDGGQHWSSAVTLERGGTNTAAAFAADGHGWAAGRTGTADSSLFASSDGGFAWKRLGAVPGDIYALSASPDGGSVWALAGPTMQPCAWGQTICGHSIAVATAVGLGDAVPAPPGATLHALAAVSTREAWAVATGPWAGTALLETTDGGQHWTVRYQSGESTPAGQWGFWNGTQGWAVGSAMDPVAVLQTSSGGRTWTRVADLPANAVGLAGFPTQKFGWALTGQGRLLLSRDGGKTWSAHALPRTACGLPSILGFASTEVGWLASGLCGSPLLRTTDGGHTWHEPAPIPNGQILAATYTASGAGWAVVEPPSRSADVLLERTPAAGEAWTPVADLGPLQWPTSGSTPLWVGATLGTDTAGGVWLDGIRSVDAGRTWTRYSVPRSDLGGPTGAPVQVEFVSSEVGWMTASGGLYQTEDGGLAWQQIGAYGRPSLR